MTNAYGVTVRPKWRRTGNGSMYSGSGLPNKLPLATLAVSYSFFVSACYLMAFWGSFGINVFQFAGLTDFAKLAIYPVALATVGIFGGTFLQAINSTLLRGGARETGRKPPHSTFLDRASVLPALVAIALIQIKGGPNSWSFGSLLFIPFLLVLSRTEFCVRYFPGRMVRQTVVLWAALMPFWLVSVGKVDAMRIKAGEGDVWVERGGAAATLTATESSHLGYVGFVGGTYMIYEPLSNSVALIKQSDGAPLILHQVTKGERSAMPRLSIIEQFLANF
ncbi:hypothetical protein R16034_02980 [Ralstonia edaphis]|uniref:Uncharacterized protein n=1 Tax=Ralstonia edaphi TaxID=3058599 RepID=A0AB72X1Q2_9RALS|nr:hypothetical protein [Ralstonia sp. LMG 6871]CAJ0742121.1 hypothetical protein R16034_02980 [Ralstonia sp. LMG 6871]